MKVHLLKMWQGLKFIVKPMKILLLAILMVMNIAIWIQLEPPASVLLTFPKIIYPNIISFVTLIIFLMLIVGTWRRKWGYWGIEKVGVKKTNYYAITSRLILLAMFFNGLVFMLNVLTQPLEYSNLSKVEFDQAHKLVLNQSKNRNQEINHIHLEKDFDLYIPTASNGLLVLYLSYGGWQKTPHQLVNPMQEHLLKRGYSFAIVTGKTLPQYDLSEVLEDVQHKIGHVKSIMPQYGLSKLVLSGGSAGGHLALMAAMSASQDLAVDGVVAYYPVVDFVYNKNYFEGIRQKPKSTLDNLGNQLFSKLDTARHAAGLVESNDRLMFDLFGENWISNQSILEYYSPITYVKNKQVPPILILHGTHDEMAPPSPSQEIYDALKNEGKAVAILNLPNVNHAFDTIAADISVPYYKSLEAVDIWLAVILRGIK